MALNGVAELNSTTSFGSFKKLQLIICYWAILAKSLELKCVIDSQCGSLEPSTNIILINYLYCADKCKVVTHLQKL